MKVGLIVQMRLDSKRLPRKALLPFANTVLAGYVLERLKRLVTDEYILASPEDSAKELAPYAADNGFDIFAGPKEDVLARYALAVKKYRLDTIIRATGDNPFVSIPLARMALSFKNDADYIAITGMPLGMGVEVVNAKALLDAYAKAKDPFDREHVCPYLYKRPELYKILKPDCPSEYFYPDGRLTIDTEQDYQNAIQLLDALGMDCSDFSILSWLKSHDAKKRQNL